MSNSSVSENLSPWNINWPFVLVAHTLSHVVLQQSLSLVQLLQGTMCSNIYVQQYIFEKMWDVFPHFVCQILKLDFVNYDF